MVRTKIFKSNQTQAVRLSKDVAFPETVREVVILREGPRRVIVPVDGVWDDFFDSPGIDFPDREPSVDRERDVF